MASFGFGVVYTSSSQDYLVEIIIYIAFLAIPPPIIILAYAYVIESRSGHVRQFHANDLSSDGNDPATAADKHAFAREWSEWAEANTKKGKVSELSSSSSREESSSEQSLCPICLDEMAMDDDVRQLPCGHIMHLACFDICFTKHVPLHAYGKNRHQCPLCREVVGPSFAPLHRARLSRRSNTPSRMLPESIWLA
ncbi:hypothetical protein FOZ62_013056 [Perkinsus olseni]|uniref:RING-type domain-containing protein n=2 Tax=Perkinsus olseni TaxID=32597 RepID=A0A7J6UCL6_PEROL|nr:hypothetical protein FOZ62_013056 [Perkinsus olseni]